MAGAYTSAVVFVAMGVVDCPSHHVHPSTIASHPSSVFDREAISRFALASAWSYVLAPVSGMMTRRLKCPVLAAVAKTSSCGTYALIGALAVSFLKPPP